LRHEIQRLVHDLAILAIRRTELQDRDARLSGGAWSRRPADRVGRYRISRRVGLRPCRGFYDDLPLVRVNDAFRGTGLDGRDLATEVSTVGIRKPRARNAIAGVVGGCLRRRHRKEKRQAKQRHLSNHDQPVPTNAPPDSVPWAGSAGSANGSASTGFASRSVDSSAR
jgi:hypothetical protein